MKTKRNGTILLLASLLLITPIAVLTACVREKENNVDLSVYSSYVIYYKEGGRKTYTEWLKEGSPAHPTEKEKEDLKGEKGADVISSYIDKKGNLVLVLSNGKVITTPLPKKKMHTVKFFLGKTLLAEKKLFHGHKLELPRLDFVYNDNWYLDEGFLSYWDVNRMNVTKSVNLYARIDSEKEFKVTLIDEKIGHTFSPLSMHFGKSYELPKPFDMNSEYLFKGWERETSEGHVDMFDNKGIWNIPKDIVLKAKWEEKDAVNLNEFGLYPQTKVVDAALLDKIRKTDQKSSRNNPIVDHYEYLHFKEGESDNYYRYEPVKWFLLKEDEKGKNYRLMTDLVIDSGAIDPDNKATSFLDSPLHKWMKTKMKDDYFVFGGREKDFIMDMNQASPSEGILDLISWDDCKTIVPSDRRVAYPSDYTIRNKVPNYEPSSNVIAYWSKTPDEEAPNRFRNHFYGYVASAGNWILGVRPVIRVSSIKK